MKQMLGVRSNSYYAQNEKKNNVELHPQMELVIIHTDGKKYTLDGENLLTEDKITESRLIVTPEGLDGLIFELQLHKSKMVAMQTNAHTLNRVASNVLHKPLTGELEKVKCECGKEETIDKALMDEGGAWMCAKCQSESSK